MIPKPTFLFEENYWKQNNLVIGVDEVGKGCFAGSVVAGAVIFQPFFSFRALTDIQKKLFATIHDSKLLTLQKRAMLAFFIPNICLSFSVEEASVEIINTEGIIKATHLAMEKAIHACIKKSGEKRKYSILIDGNILIKNTPSILSQQAIIKGDQKSISIASASIIAKVYRDSLMKKLDKLYPQYNLAKNKGYGTKDHQKALKNYGLSLIHRTSFNLEKFL